MLIGRPTPFGAGIAVFGSSDDLQAFYDVTSDLMERTHELHEEFLLSLNYEIRKADEGERETATFGAKGELHYQGFRMLWPHFLFVMAQVRHLAALEPITVKQRAFMLQVDHIIEVALRAMDPTIGADAFGVYQQIKPMSDDYLTTFIEQLNFDYACTGPDDNARCQRLPQLLRDISPTSDAYRTFAAEVDAIAEVEGMERTEVAFDYDWEDFNW